MKLDSADAISNLTYKQENFIFPLFYLTQTSKRDEGGGHSI